MSARPRDLNLRFDQHEVGDKSSGATSDGGGTAWNNRASAKALFSLPPMAQLRRQATTV